MAHEHSVFNTDERFLIDPDTRSITQQSGKNRLVQYDHNSERFEFQIPRRIEDHDMSQCNDIKVNYLNVSSNRQGQSNGPYKVTDVRVDPKDSNLVVFSWLISRSATKYAGTLNFNISFRCVNNGVVDYSWSTEVFKGISVGTGIENNGTEHVEDYIDILEQWKQEVLANLDTTDGTVTSVNGIMPDENGNVEITIPEAKVKTVNGVEPDAEGNVEIIIPEAKVKTVNGQNPDESGNILVDIPTDEHINSLIDDKFNVVTIVKSVNGLSPDETGNVELNVETSDDALQMLVEMDVIQPFVVDDCILVDANNNVLTV